MRENNLFSFFKSESRFVKILISNRMVIILRSLLFFNVVYVKKSLFLAFFTNLLKNKKAPILKLSSIDLKLNFVL
jgi:hypothetical protein